LGQPWLMKPTLGLVEGTWDMHEPHGCAAEPDRGAESRVF